MTNYFKDLDEFKHGGTVKHPPKGKGSGLDKVSNRPTGFDTPGRSGNLDVKTKKRLSKDYKLKDGDVIRITTR